MSLSTRSEQFLLTKANEKVKIKTKEDSQIFFQIGKQTFSDSQEEIQSDKIENLIPPSPNLENKVIVRKRRLASTRSNGMTSRSCHTVLYESSQQAEEFPLKKKSSSFSIERSGPEIDDDGEDVEDLSDGNLNLLFEQSLVREIYMANEQTFLNFEEEEQNSLNDKIEEDSSNKKVKSRVSRKESQKSQNSLESISENDTIISNPEEVEPNNLPQSDSVLQDMSINGEERIISQKFINETTLNDTFNVSKKKTSRRSSSKNKKENQGSISENEESKTETLKSKSSRRGSRRDSKDVIEHSKSQESSNENFLSEEKIEERIKSKSSRRGSRRDSKNFIEREEQNLSQQSLDRNEIQNGDDNGIVRVKSKSSRRVSRQDSKGSLEKIKNETETLDESNTKIKPRSSRKASRKDSKGKIEKEQIKESQEFINENGNENEDEDLKIKKYKKSRKNSKGILEQTKNQESLGGNENSDTNENHENNATNENKGTEEKIEERKIKRTKSKSSRGILKQRSKGVIERKQSQQSLGENEKENGKENGNENEERKEKTPENKVKRSKSKLSRSVSIQDAVGKSKNQESNDENEGTQENQIKRSKSKLSRSVSIQGTIREESIDKNGTTEKSKIKRTKSKSSRRGSKRDSKNVIEIEQQNHNQNQQPLDGNEMIDDKNDSKKEDEFKSSNPTSPEKNQNDEVVQDAP